MHTNIGRSEFLKQLLLLVGGGTLHVGLIHKHSSSNEQQEHPLFDWSPWELYRKEIIHPTLAIKEEDINCALANINRYQWAKNYRDNIRRNASYYLKHTSAKKLENLIEWNTPGDPLWTPCPACRDKEMPVHPHGLWKWDVLDPNVLECAACGTKYPNKSYPEDLIIETKWRHPQKLSYYGGTPFSIFGFKEGRPSFSANIRARKVQWSAAYCRLCAEAYILTGKPEFGHRCREILLRFATCYPSWLVHVGYGEYADMDPKVAAMYIKDLPHPEITPSPNVPDHQLWTGYWSAGRAGGVGLESDFVRKVVEAYDLTCDAVDDHGRPLFSEAERIKIERDLLLESSILLVCDESINNKSVSNRTAAAMVGMCVGHPGLVRFGLEGFEKTMHEWFLEDGCTSESPFYGLMTLGGIWDLAQAMRSYSDPAAYSDANGTRYDQLDLNQKPAYKKIWQALFNGLRGDLRYPCFADSFEDLEIDPSYVELMVANYQDPAYVSLLKEFCGKDLNKPTGSIAAMYEQYSTERIDMTGLTLPYDLAKPTSTHSFALYYRDPDLKRKAAPALILPDWCPDALRIGHMRTGIDGRESLLTLNASRWGKHHERDSLHLSYWKKGSEILSDLGYLWDHPKKKQTQRTVAHNTVVVDEEDQSAKGRLGSVQFFKHDNHVKVMRATSKAYAQTSVYKRTSATIDHGLGRDYVVDFFEVAGGQIQDYVFHLSGDQYEIIDVSFSPWSGQLYDFTNIKSATAAKPWRLEWMTDQALTCRAWVLSEPGEQVFIANGWAQRDWKNSDIGAKIPYVLRRCQGGGKKTFITVYEGFERDESFVKGVHYHGSGSIIVDTLHGRDYIMSKSVLGELEMEEWDIDPLFGYFAVASMEDRDLKWKFTVDQVDMR